MLNPSKTSPKGGKRGCLCLNNTYSSECCNGQLIAQGIGATEGGIVSNIDQAIFQRDIDNVIEQPIINEYSGTVTQSNGVRTISGSN